jgi:hypothetical protein
MADYHSVDPTLVHACADGHTDIGGICGICGEWLPMAFCREPACRWIVAIGEGTLDAAVVHHRWSGHHVRVVIN